MGEKQIKEHEQNMADQQVLFKLFNEKSSPVDNLFKSSTTGLECSVWYWMPGLCPNRWILGIPIGVLVVGSVFVY